jgi:uncharacterized membrane protein
MPGVLGLLFTFMLTAAAAHAPNLTLKFSKVDVPGAKQTYPNGINNDGVIVGGYQDSAGLYHGFILDGNKFTAVNVPKGANTTVDGITPNGAIQIVGSYTNSAGRDMGFLYKNGHYTDIPGPKGSGGSSAVGINDDGDIVGSYLGSNGVTFGYVLTKQGYTTLNIYMAQITVASGINDKGKVVFSSVNGLNGDETAYLYDIKTKEQTEINVPGASDSAAGDINNAGDVSYQWLDSNDGSHCALFLNGKYYKFDYPKSAYDWAKGINNDNTFVGAYEAASGGPFSGFKATYK